MSDYLTQLITLKSAVRDVYFAGYWHADRPVEEAKLWERLRDAAGINSGQTLEILGLDRTV